MVGLSAGRVKEDSPTPRLPLARFRFRFEAAEPVRLPAYSGSAWRGALGHALKRAVCATGLPACKECVLYHACTYPYIFDTPPPPGSQKMRLYTAAPHPFVLEPPHPHPHDVARGEVFDLGLTLMGRANASLPYLVHALASAGEGGIGRERGRFLLIDVAQSIPPDGWASIYTGTGTVRAEHPLEPAVPVPPKRTRVVLLTPLRILNNGLNVTPATFRFSHLFRSLLRRISMLTYFHTDTPLETDFAALTARSNEVPLLETDLRWYDWSRYSTRQRARMELGGLLGTFDVALEGFADLWPYLWLGRHTHAGKATSMGLGRYVVEHSETAASLSPRTSGTG